jgi:hypothetical protein
MAIGYFPGMRAGIVGAEFVGPLGGISIRCPKTMQLNLTRLI